jgi:DNA-binding MarR family transcriptional regulator
VANDYPTDPLVAQVRRGATRLARRLRFERPADSLSLTKLSVLAHLHRGDAVTPGEIAAADWLQPQSLTRVLAELEADGLITRSRDAYDRRQFVLGLTADGAAVLAADMGARDRWLAEAMRGLSETERQVLYLAGKLMDRLSGPDRAHALGPGPEHGRGLERGDGHEHGRERGHDHKPEREQGSERRDGHEYGRERAHDHEPEREHGPEHEHGHGRGHDHEPGHEAEHEHGPGHEPEPGSSSADQEGGTPTPGIEPGPRPMPRRGPGPGSADQEGGVAAERRAEGEDAEFGEHHDDEAQ